MAKKVALEIDVKSDSVGQANKKVESATTELRRLKRELASGGLTGKEFEEASKRAGILQDRISDVSQRVKNLASDTRQLDAVVSAAQGMAGGFALAQGAAALFGSENEELQKTFVKLQATMTALTGLQQLANTLNKDSALSTLLFSRAQTTATGTTSGLIAGLTGLRAALMTIGIGVFVAAIGALVVNYEKLKNLFKSNIDLLKEDISLQKQRRDLISSEMETMDLQLENLKLQGKEFRYIRKQQLQNLDLQLESLENEIKKTKEIKEQQVKNATNIGWWQRGVALLKAQYSITWGLNHIQGEIKSNLTEIEETTAKLKDLENDRLRIQNKLLGIEKEINTERKTAADKLAAANKAAREKADAAEMVNEERRLELIRDANEREFEQLILKQERQFAAAVNNGEDLNLLLQVQLQERNQLITKQVDFELDEEQRKNDEFKKSQEELNDFVDKVTDKQIDDAEKMAAFKKRQNEITVQSTQQAFAALSMLFENGSKEQKAFALASIAIDTGRAIGQALANSQSPTPDNVLTGGLAGVAKFAAIAASILSGAAQARQVLKGGANFSASGSISQPTQQFQPPTLQQNTQGIRLQDNRVYVLESDISTTQRRVRTLESRSVID
jgi:DNA repair exonuclease SbcCD ATPase subunit